MISTKIDEMFSFWKVLNIPHIKFQENQHSFLFNDALRHNCTHDVITEIQPGISKSKSSCILLKIATKIGKIFLLRKLSRILLIQFHRRATSKTTKDALRHNCIHDDITEILPGICKLNYSSILLMISVEVYVIFSFQKSSEFCSSCAEEIPRHKSEE